MSERHSIGGKFYEFFAGGGMARAGLGPSWTCLFANDIDAKKASSYARNWGETEFETADVAKLSTVDLPGRADLAWASFPCQDLSLAGMGAGLKGSRSGTFWSFWNLITGLAREGRLPDLVVLENVVGTLTSRGGEVAAGTVSRHPPWLTNSVSAAREPPVIDFATLLINLS